MAVHERRLEEVLVYDDADALAQSVAGYLADGAPDGISLVLARPERLACLERALEVAGVDVAAARRAERFVTLDAEAILAAILVDGMPDRAAFHERVGAVVDRLARRGPLRVYGEMADLLWSSGRLEALGCLESLWSELRAGHRFTLLRSYRSDESAGAGAQPAARTVAELERRVSELELRVRRSEAERDRLVRACREAREAQRAAEDAVRARDEITAVVTHDLRSPLGTIVMGATALLELGASDPRAQRVRTVAERIHRQAERMARQIRDLADFAAIQTGPLAIERAPCAPSEIIASVRELVAPIAGERGIAFEAHAAAELPAIDCDPERVAQALVSLIGHAMKVTPRGGAIEVGARAAEHGPVFFVRHDGPGPDREGLAALFGKQPGQRGAGLGFTIARGVVDAHGGAIWADSGPDAGSTVCFSLTPPRN